MTPEYVRLRPEWTIAYALDHIRRYGRDSETLNHVFVIDERGRLIDDIRIRTVLLAAPTQLVSDIMDNRYVALTATDDQETAVAVFRREDRTALPVTDTAYGIFNTGYGVFWFLGSALMGVLYDVSLPALILFSVAAQLLAIPLLLLVRNRPT